MLNAGIIIAIIVGVLVVIGGIIGIIVALFKGITPSDSGGARRFNLTKFKGNVGENIVARILGDTVAGEKYVLNNVLFEDRKGRSCQIDHIYINKHGIWIIETKNYSGKIYGNDNWHEWTQVLSYGSVKNKFYNPVKQNATHIYMLSEQIRERNVFNNLVVFLRGADISNVRSENVCSVSELRYAVNEDTGLILSPLQMDRYYKRLSALKENSTICEDEHIKNIQTLKNNIRLGICPRCGTELVLRDGPNGQFYGCGKYPKCKFRKSL